jgi:hypothetical protein
VKSRPPYSLPLKLLAILEVGGAGYGIYSLSQAGIRSLSPFGVVVLGALTVLYFLSLVAGVLLARGSQFGILCSVFLQWLQVVWLSTPVFSYRFYSGACLFLGMSEGSPGFDFRMGSGWDFHLTRAGAPLSFALNVIPILALILLRMVRLQERQGQQECLS